MTIKTEFSWTAKVAIWIAMLAAWVAQAFAANNPLDADAVSYLDMAYSCLSGNWHALVHGYWSPGYPFLLALWLRLFQGQPVSRTAGSPHVDGSQLDGGVGKLRIFSFRIFRC